MLDYVEMTGEEVEKLIPEQTVFLISVSPIEAHGPHLPLGTDIFVAEALVKRYRDAIRKNFPEVTPVKLPPLFLGSDALPYRGSLSIPAPLLKKVLINLVKGLAFQGFRYLLVADNHGGPRHQMAVEAAARRVWKKYRFHMIDPFGWEYRQMVLRQEGMLNETGLEPGYCGDDEDAHGGSNETSLMLACCPQRVRSCYQEIESSIPPPPNPILKRLASAAGWFSEELEKELVHLAYLTSWIKHPQMKPYLGKPGHASKGAGEAMLQYREKTAMEFLQQAFQGKPPNIQPLLWKLRLFQYLPE